MSDGPQPTSWAAKGYNVVFTLEGGRRVRAPRGAELLHDEDGVRWPKCSGLVMRFRRTGQTLQSITPKVQKHFGDNHRTRRGLFMRPDPSLAGWTRVGRVERVDYTRRGQHAGIYTHPFEEHGLLVWKTDLPVLYRRGSMMRIELGPGCVWNWRGFVRP